MHRSRLELDAGLPDIASSPADGGRLAYIVRRPARELRETLDVAVLDVATGLEGDDWPDRPGASNEDGSPNREAQLALMNVRVARLIAGTEERIALAEDQLYVDLDLSEDNLPAGSRLTLGTAVIEISHKPHTGCLKYRDRFGQDVLNWVSTPDGRRLRLRGVNARIVVTGTVEVGASIAKI